MKQTSVSNLDKAALHSLRTLLTVALLKIKNAGIHMSKRSSSRSEPTARNAIRKTIGLATRNAKHQRMPLENGTLASSTLKVSPQTVAWTTLEKMAEV